MNSINKMVLVGLMASFGAVVQSNTVLADPVVTIQSERAAHPRLVQAIHNMRGALRELEAAPDDFGGNKAVAIADTRKAIHSLKRALYFRLKMDDAALERAE